MINLFITLFKSETVQILGTDDARIALAALMVRLARTDGDYAAIEITMIDRILSNRYNLDETATQIKISFFLHTDGSITKDGWYIV